MKHTVTKSQQIKINAKRAAKRGTKVYKSLAKDRTKKSEYQRAYRFAKGLTHNTSKKFKEAIRKHSKMVYRESLNQANPDVIMLHGHITNLIHLYSEDYIPGRNGNPDIGKLSGIDAETGNYVANRILKDTGELYTS